MSTERLIPHFVRKPWGVERLPEWLLPVPSDEKIGEVWYRKEWPGGRQAKLLVKYLLTSERLSVQVHPDDLQALSQEGARGKSEAWYVLGGEKNAEIGLGLTRSATAAEVTAAALDGSIVGLLDWRKADKGAVFYVPAGTIHAIGAGCVLVEVQQNSDTTYRLFDYGRPRELHLTQGLAVARLAPADRPPPAQRLDDWRESLVRSEHFALERWTFAGRTQFRLGKGEEVWLILLAGSLEIQGARFMPGEVAFHSDDSAAAVVGEEGASLIVAYPGGETMIGLLTEVQAAAHPLWDEGHNPGIDPGQSEDF